MMTSERMQVERVIAADPSTIFAVLADPKGQVAIDSSGMLQSSTGESAAAVGDTFVIHMDREALNDYPLGKYDVTVSITKFDKDREIAWTIFGQLEPPIGRVAANGAHHLGLPVPEVAEAAGDDERQPQQPAGHDVRRLLERVGRVRHAGPPEQDQHDAQRDEDPAHDQQGSRLVGTAGAG